MKPLKLALLMITIAVTLKTNENVNPISKIKIKSNKAVCKKDSNHSNLFSFEYIDNVHIKFADETTASCNKLYMVIDTSPSVKKTETKKSLDNLKKISLKGKVLIKKENRSIESENASINPLNKTCELWEKVIIRQEKKLDKDLPLVTKCEKAILNLETNKVTLLGNPKAPVSTQITLENHPGLLKKIKSPK